VTVYLLAYLTVLVLFILFDSVWLMSMTRSLYRPVLGDILVDHLRAAPAIAFYLLYPLGIVIFSVAPALKATSILPAISYGALFGFFAYATYDLTNFATLRNWTAHITIIDIAWGAVVTGATATLAYLVVQALASYFGLISR